MFLSYSHFLDYVFIYNLLYIKPSCIPYYYKRVHMVKRALSYSELLFPEALWNISLSGLRCWTSSEGMVYSKLGQTVKRS